MQHPISILIAAALAAGTAVAGDWPQILGPNRDGQAIGETIPAWTEPPAIRWRVPCGAGYSGIAVADARVLLWHRQGEEEVLDCLSAEDGRRQWRASFPAIYRGGVDADRGPRSVPVVEGDRAFVYGAAGDLHAVALADGKPLWSRQFDFGRRGPTVNAGTPLVDGTQLFVTASYGVGSRMLDMASDPPKDLWTQRDVISSQYATPVRSGGWIDAISGREDFGNAGLLCARWTDGQVAWRRPDFGTAHLIAAGDRVLAQLTDGRLELFAAESEAFRRLAASELPEGTYRVLPALAEGVLYCRRTISATEGELLALEL